MFLTLHPVYFLLLWLLPLLLFLWHMVNDVLVWLVGRDWRNCDGQVVDRLKPSSKILPPHWAKFHSPTIAVDIITLQMATTTHLHTHAILRPLFQAHPGEPAPSQRRDLLEQPMGFFVSVSESRFQLSAVWQSRSGVIWYQTKGPWWSVGGSNWQCIHAYRRQVPTALAPCTWAAEPIRQGRTFPCHFSDWHGNPHIFRASFLVVT